MLRASPRPHHPATFLFVCLATLVAHAQTAPVALRKVDFSVFAGYTANQTGLANAGNRSVTFGAAINLPESHRIRPSLEVRALSPFDRGLVDGQRSILGGFRIETRIDRVHPYLDLLGGRGQITFVHPYTRYDGSFLYSQPPSNVISPGLGARVDLTGRLSFLLDAQIQRWSTPASLSGHLFSKPVTLGLSYRITTHSRHPGR